MTLTNCTTLYNRIVLYLVREELYQINFLFLQVFPITVKYNIPFSYLGF